MEQERKNGEYGSCMQMIEEMWCGQDEENINDLCELGHKKSRLQILG